MSMLPRCQWPTALETEAATTWLAPVPTATAGGTPRKISSGVMMKPPPTPNMPDRKPIARPIPNSRNALRESSATGRYICMDPRYTGGRQHQLVGRWSGIEFGRCHPSFGPDLVRPVRPLPRQLLQPAPDEPGRVGRLTEVGKRRGDGVGRLHRR